MPRTRVLPARSLALAFALLIPLPAAADLVGNPSFESGTTGWSLYGSGTMTRVAGGHTGGFSVQFTGTSSTSNHFGINDNPNWIGAVAAAGTRYRFTCWVRSNAATGTVKIKVKEFLGSTQKGATVYSAGTRLSPVWQQATVDYVVTTAGTTLDLVVEDYPAASSESWFIDDVAIENLSSPATDDPPIARLSLSQVASPARTLRADASASTDLDATPIASYRFDFGDGTTPVTTTTAIAQHTYAVAGPYTVSVIATDTGGKASAPAAVTLTVTDPLPPPDLPPVARLAVSQLTSPPLTVEANAAGSSDTDATPIASYTFDFGDGTPLVTVLAPVTKAQHTYADLATYVVSLIATDTGGQASAPDTTAITIAPPNSAPVADLVVRNLASPPRTVLADASGSTDADSKPLDPFAVDCGDGTPPVVTREPTVTAQHTYAAAGDYIVSLIATDNGGLSSFPATATVTVPDAPPVVNLVGNPSFETGTSGWAAYGGGTMTRVAGGRTGSFQVQCKGPSSTSSHFGLEDSPPWVQVVARVGARYRFTCWVRSDASRGAVKIKVKEFLGSSQKGSTVYSPGVTLSPTWQPVTIDYVVTTAGTTLDLVVEDYPVSGSESWFVDDLAIENVSGGGATDDPPVARLALSQLASPARTVRADASASTDADATPIASYRFSFGDGTAAVTTTAPTAVAQHTYAAIGRYTVSVIATDTGGKPSAAATAAIDVTATATPGPSNVAVYVGYYDTHHPGRTQPKPDPWQGSSGVVFVGKADGSSGGWDSSAIRVDNLGTTTLSNVVVTVDIGSKHWALWGTQSIPAGQKLVLAQTGYENFDGSDTNPAGCYGCSPSLCLSKVQSTIPVVHVSVAGAQTHYLDSGQILNTHGVDQAGCPYTGTRNDESSNWRQVLPATTVLVLGEAGQTDGAPLIPERRPALELSRPRPNPTRGEALIDFAVPESGPVRLAVYDVSGRRVQTPIDATLEAGQYITRVDLNGLPGGVYFCALSTGQGVRRQTLMRVP